MKNKFWIGIIISSALMVNFGILFILLVVLPAMVERNAASSFIDAIGFLFIIPPFLLSIASFITFTIIYLVKRKNLKEQEEILQFEKERIKKHEDNEKYHE